MNAEYPFQKSPRCRATSKRTGRRCQAPAVKGWKVCRFHGARSGAPTGKRNGNYRHGDFTKEARNQRRVVSAMLGIARKMIADRPPE
jgi:hypothetical protein